MSEWKDTVESRLARLETLSRRPVEDYPARSAMEDQRLADGLKRSGRVVVNCPLDLFIVDAPNDGGLYARKNEAWVNAMELAWPVGSIFVSAVSTNPATLLGIGTWTAIGAGRVLVGQDSGDTDFDTLGETGGAKTVTSAGSVSQPTFSGSALGTHTHGTGSYAAANESAHTHSVTSNVAVGNHDGHSHTFTSSSNAATPDLLSPDLTGTGVAASGTTSTEIVSAHSVTNNAVTSAAGSAHTHSLSGSSEAVSAGTPAGTVSQPTFAGSATSVVQPYLVVKLWQRTA